MQTFLVLSRHLFSLISLHKELENKAYT